MHPGALQATFPRSSLCIQPTTHLFGNSCKVSVFVTKISIFDTLVQPTPSRFV